MTRLRPQPATSRPRRSGRNQVLLWADNKFDDTNVNELGMVSAAEVAVEMGSGTWSMKVWSRDLHTEKQAYALVITGASSPVSDDSTVSTANSVPNV